MRRKYTKLKDLKEKPTERSTMDKKIHVVAGFFILLFLIICFGYFVVFTNVTEKTQEEIKIEKVNTKREKIAEELKQAQQDAFEAQVDDEIWNRNWRKKYKEEREKYFQEKFGMSYYEAMKKEDENFKKLMQGK